MSHAIDMIEVLVDGDPVAVPRDTTANAILVAAGLDPASHYLVLKLGRGQQESFQGRGDDPVKVHPRETFVSLSTGPTPTS